MIKSLRKKHLVIWTVVAILLPVGIISAYLVVPVYKNTRVLQAVTTYPLPVVLKTIDRGNYTASLRIDTGRAQVQLEWKNNIPAGHPSALIYQLSNAADDIAGGTIIGRVEAQGDFYFPLKAGLKDYHFVLYDIIHHQKIDSINFYK
ncbi:MAG: hypothetical protein QM791_01480 [Ferruginibacter sp.]